MPGHCEPLPLKAATTFPGRPATPVTAVAVLAGGHGQRCLGGLGRSRGHDGGVWRCAVRGAGDTRQGGPAPAGTAR